jgi:microcystin-dependent protein
MSIQILENTLLKLLVRRGTNFDRQQITLETGELGYTTDTKRLYIGDGTTKGGIIVGNKWAGEAADLTSLAPVASGDYAYDTDNREFKILVKGTGSVAADWVTVATYLSAFNPSINIDANNRISVGTLSAGNFSLNAIGNSLTIDGSEKLALSSTISIDKITQNSTGLTDYLTLPSKVDVGGVPYTFPTTGPQKEDFLAFEKSNGAGGSQLAWKVPKEVLTAVAPTTAALIPVGSIQTYAGPLTSAPYGWLNCNGQAVNAVTYSELLTALNGQYGRNFTDNTFNVPNLSSTFIHGFDSTTNSLGAQFPSRGVGLSAQKTTLSAVGMNFIIKAFGGVTNPTYTIGKNLSATITSGSGVTQNVTDTAFNPLSGEVRITRPQPGMQIYDTPNIEHTFKMPGGVSYVKFYVTGSGSPGDKQSGNAGATAIGYLSAKPGTEFPVIVGAAPIGLTSGQTSYIYEPKADGNDPIVTAPGGAFGSIDAASPTIAESGYLPTGTLRILGGVGFIDTDDGGDEEDVGGAGFYGHSPAYGGGGGSHADKPASAAVATGVVVFEWN